MAGAPSQTSPESRELQCSRHRCSRRVVACVVYVGAGLDEAVAWRIEPTCRKHLKLHEDTARRARHRDYPGVFRHHPNLTTILRWITEDRPGEEFGSALLRSADTWVVAEDQILGIQNDS